MRIVADPPDELIKRDQPLIGAGKRERRKIGHYPLPHRALLAGQPLKRIIVKHQRLAIGGFLDVQLETVACGDRRLDRRDAVFGAAILMQPKMPEGASEQPTQASAQAGPKRERQSAKEG